MAVEEFSCGGCSRGCTVKILQEGGKVYLDGNKCIGGEQQIRLNRPELADKEFFKLSDKETKKGFWKGLFSGKRQ